jgi:hypothetical protein
MLETFNWVPALTEIGAALQARRISRSQRL